MFLFFFGRMGHGWAKAQDDETGEGVHGGGRQAALHSAVYRLFPFSSTANDDTNEPATTLLARTRQLHADMDG
jgi:hypothetical protein